jgi:hypothetical protein
MRRCANSVRWGRARKQGRCVLRMDALATQNQEVPGQPQPDTSLCIFMRRGLPTARYRNQPQSLVSTT